MTIHEMRFYVALYAACKDQVKVSLLLRDGRNVDGVAREILQPDTLFRTDTPSPESRIRISATGEIFVSLIEIDEIYFHEACLVDRFVATPWRK